MVDAAADHPWLAILASFVWGLCSVILSPCHLAGIPLLVGFMGAQGKMSAGRTWALSSAFATGVLMMFAAVGLLTFASGRILGDVGAWGGIIAALTCFVVGLYLLGALSLPSGGGSSRWKNLASGGGVLAGVILGLVFGLALGPCAFAYAAPILGVVFKMSSSAPLFSAAMIGTYALAHCGLIAVAGASFGLTQKALHWNESKMAKGIKTACGVLLILAGLYFLYQL